MMSTPKSPGVARSTLESDPELVARAQAGDPSAQDQLFRRHQPSAYRLALSLCHGQREDAEDTSQNALFKAHSHLGDFRGDSKFSTWLSAIVINECRLHWSRQHRESKWRRLDLETRTGQTEGVPIELADNKPDPEEQYTLLELQAKLTHCFLMLPYEQRLAFSLREFEHSPNPEIAALLGCSVSAAKNLLHRARLRLRSCLSSDFCPSGQRYWREGHCV